MRVLNNRTFTVSNGSKILKWKQITTNPYRVEITCNCFQWFKDTKMKANHNTKVNANTVRFTVSNGSKILKWKQITTLCWYVPRFRNCFQWFKDTKMKANHNGLSLRERLRLTVSNGSKILKWKQITTHWYGYVADKDCFQWFKDTKMKANHNTSPSLYPKPNTVSNGSKILKWKQITTSKFGQSKNSSLFPMVQRY